MNSTSPLALPPVEYPRTRREDAIETLAGVEFPDPYRWLEDNSAEVRHWQTAQADLASEYVRRWPHFESLKSRIASFTAPRYPAFPLHAGGRWFRIATPEGATQAQVIVSRTPTGDGELVFDPSQISDPPPYVSWISPSPDGRILAFGLCSDGSEVNAMHLIDVASGAHLPDAPTRMLMDNWLGGAQWLADSSGFFYTALVGNAHDFQQAVYFHRIGNPEPDRVEPIPVQSGSRDYRGVIVSRDGRWATALHGLFACTPVALRDLSDPNSDWRPFITDIIGLVAGHVIGDRYIAVTDVEALCGRIVAIPLHATTPNDPTTWEEIVPESDAVIRSVTPVGERLYGSEFVDTYSRVRIFDLDGKPCGEVPLPGRGAVSELPFPIMNLSAHADTAFEFGFSTLVESLGVYRHHGEDGRLETITEPQVRIDGAVVEDHWAISADGAQVPYHLVRLESTDPGQVQSGLIFAYGAAGVPTLPHFPGAAAAFIASGGVFVHAHLRGGGELGHSWWQDGTLQNRQNSYADLYAVAEDLIAKGRTTPARLGVTGGSAGGLMCGVAVNQRPDLWRVAILRVPVLDLIGGCRDPYIRYVAGLEYGDIDDPEEVRRIAAFSPYQLVKDEETYPAVYIGAGDTDTRCRPWHARKFAARLQAAQVGTGPVLLHVWENAGHGRANAKNMQLAENTECLAFAMQALGMIPPMPEQQTIPPAPELGVL